MKVINMWELFMERGTNWNTLATVEGGDGHSFESPAKQFAEGFPARVLGLKSLIIDETFVSLEENYLSFIFIRLFL